MIPVFAVALISAFLQFTALNYVRVGPFAIDLQVIVLVFFSLRKGPAAGLSIGLLFGMFNSFFDPGSFFVNILLYPLMGLIIGFISEWFYRESLWTFLVMFFCAFLAAHFSFYLVKALPAAQLGPIDYSFRLFLPAAAYNIPAAIFLFYFLKRVR